MKKLLLWLLLGGSGGMNGAVCWGQLLPALAVEEIEIQDAAAYAALVEEINGAMKAKYEVRLFLRAYESTSTTGRGKRAFSLSPSASFAGLMENQARFEEDGEFAVFRERLAELSDSSGRVFLKAVRFDGTNSPGWLLNTLVKTGDEAGLLGRLEADFATSGWEEGMAPKVNVFRVAAGEARFTHLVSLNFESRAALGVGLDVLGERAWRLSYAEDGEVICEVVESVVWRELER